MGDMGDDFRPIPADERESMEEGRRFGENEKEELLQLLENTAKLLRGMTMDPAIPAHAKDSMMSRAKELEAMVLLAEAIEDIDSWASYASDYFRDKHDLAGTLARYRAALGEKHG